MRKHLLALSIFAICLFIFFKPVLMEGKIYSLGGIVQGDFLNFHYPNFEFLRESLVSGRLPWWNSRIGNGYPIIAEGEMGAFYPPNLLLLRFFPTNIAIALLLFLHLILVAFGTYLVTLKLTKSSLASVIAGLSFSLSGYVITQLTEVSVILTFSWFPLLFLSYLNLREKTSISRLFILGFFFAFSILAGSLTILYYESLVLFIYSLVVSGLKLRLQIKSFFILVLAILIAASLSAVQLAPSFELFKSSLRQPGENIDTQEIFQFPKEGFLSFLGVKPPTKPEWFAYVKGNEGTMLLKNPYDYYSYVGILAVLILPFGFLVLIKRKNFGLIVLLFWVFLMTLGINTPIFKTFYEVIPGMKYFRHAIRFLAFIEFFLIIISSFGLAHLLSWLEKRIKKFVWLFVLIVFVDLYSHQAWVNPTGRQDFWLKKPEMFSQLTISKNFRVSGFDMVEIDFNSYNNEKLQRQLANYLPANYVSIFGISTDRVFSPLEISYSTIFNFNVVGYEDIFDFGYGKDKLSGKVQLEEETIKNYRAHAVKYFTSPIPLESPSIKLLRQEDLSTPVSYILKGRTVNTSGKTIKPFDVPVKIEKIYLYEIGGALSRVRIVGNGLAPIAAQNKDSPFPSNLDPEKEIIVSEIENNQAPGGKGKAEIIVDSENSLEINTQADKPAWLYLADTYYPGWHAYVDGAETKIYKANYAFRAIKIPGGEHKVEFIYKQQSYEIGKTVSLISLGATFVLLLSAYLRVRKRFLK